MMTLDANPGTPENGKALDLRRQLVEVSLEWESHLGVAPSVTSAISELDAALLVGMNEGIYCADGKLRSAVSKDTDFVCNGIRYQVTANRPSGKKGSFVTLVNQKTEKKKPFGWDRLIWILYDDSTFFRKPGSSRRKNTERDSATLPGYLQIT